MEYKKINVNISSDGVDLLCGMLYDYAAELEIFDESELRSYIEAGCYDYVEDALLKCGNRAHVAAYVADNDSGREKLEDICRIASQLAQSYPQYGISVEVTCTHEQDWANNWKQYYKPIEVGEKILIKPAWETLQNADPSRVVFTIEPGMAFGTGSHESTRLCLAAIERHLHHGGSVLDIGCGTGILSIVALLLGAGHAVAVDIDQNAVRIARDNAEMNDIHPDKYKLLCGDIINDTQFVQNINNKYDIIVSNITADIIIKVIPIIKPMLAEHGVYIASGIIVQREQDVRNALAQSGFNIMDAQTQNDWVALVASI